MKKEELTNGSSISFRGGEFLTNNKKEINIPPEKSGKLTIATIAKIKELEKSGFLEINVGIHDIIRDSEGKIKRRIDSKTGKELTSEKEEKSKTR